MRMLQKLRQLEVELHQPEIREDRERLEFLLHESFMECGRSGRIYTRSEILNELAQESMQYSVWSQDFSVTKLSDQLMLLTYRSAHLFTDGILSSHAFRSSLWQHSKQGWKIRFHQGTPTEEFERNTS